MMDIRTGKAAMVADGRLRAEDLRLVNDEEQFARRSSLTAVLVLGLAK
jgi:hypothetical protein